MIPELLLLLGLTADLQVYPPKDVILIQNSNIVPLRWSLPGRHFKVEVMAEGRLLWSGETYGQHQEVSVAPGQSVHWVVTDLGGGGRYENDFSRAREFEYHADGVRAGTIPVSGGSLQVRLGRDGNGMNMLIIHRGVRQHYIFSQPGMRFKVSCRGSEGLPGLSFGPDTIIATAGGNGGEGGRILVTTDSAPWRDFLDLDVSGGTGGLGGKLLTTGGNPPYPPPRAESGQDGKPGRIETRIEPIWK